MVFIKNVEVLDLKFKNCKFKENVMLKVIFMNTYISGKNSLRIFNINK